MSEYRCMVTGNRPFKLSGAKFVEYRRKLEEHIVSLHKVHGKELVVLSGLALGPDQWAVNVCMKYGIKFDAYIPFEGQEYRWSQLEQSNYRKLLLKANRVFICSECPSRLAYLRRNDDMVVDCNEAVAVFNGDAASGTGYTVRRLRAACKPYTNVCNK